MRCFAVCLSNPVPSTFLGKKSVCAQSPLLQWKVPSRWLGQPHWPPRASLQAFNTQPSLVQSALHVIPTAHRRLSATPRFKTHLPTAVGMISRAQCMTPTHCSVLVFPRTPSCSLAVPYLSSVCLKGSGNITGRDIILKACMPSSCLWPDDCFPSQSPVLAEVPGRPLCPTVPAHVCNCLFAQLLSVRPLEGKGCISSSVVALYAISGLNIS